jgi:hypothetical protein
MANRYNLIICIVISIQTFCYSKLWFGKLDHAQIKFGFKWPCGYHLYNQAKSNFNYITKAYTTYQGKENQKICFWLLIKIYNQQKHI